jgi:4-amino-4-deoxy-L-arabinose transferase-like glycosyltransferase
MNKPSVIFFSALLLVIGIGFNIDLMDIDAAQYASISKEMLHTGNYLHVYDAGKDYLDKPPFLFWISSLSMKIFGAGNFGYRLPSFLLALLALYSTFKLSSLYYSRERSVIAAIVLGCSQGFILMNHDVRTDTLLMGWVIFSIWQLALWFKNQKFLNLILGSMAISLGMMTKGPVALMVPAFAFLPQLLLQKKVKLLFKWENIPALLIICLLLIPMSWGLYDQFDKHPEKIVNEATGVSGLRFYYWTQSFGRITGESGWNNNSNIFFLLQNMLWSFLPWIIIFLIALYTALKQLIANRFKLNENEEIICLSGFILTYLSLGLSKYQLPHYIFVAFPFAAIITSGWLYDVAKDMYDKWAKPLLYFHFSIYVILWVALIFLLIFPFPEISKIWSASALIVFSGMVYVFFSFKNRSLVLFTISVYTILGLNLFTNGLFYPELLKFQGGSNMGRWMHQHQIPASKTAIFQNKIWRSLNFYAGGTIIQKDSLNLYHSGEYMITGLDNLKALSDKKIKYELLFQTVDYPVTRLSIDFLIPENREKELLRLVLIKLI